MTKRNHRDFTLINLFSLCVCVQVHEYVPSLCMCTCVCMRRSKVDAPCVPQGLSINLEITGSITESAQQAGGFSSLCLLLIAGLTGVCSVFYTRTGDLNLHLYACTPSTWPRSYLPSTDTYVFLIFLEGYVVTFRAE